MKLLACDTSTSNASVALFNQGEITELKQAGYGQHAQCILTMIERLLTESSLTVSQLDGLVFGRGPGSFTGLRIACSLAKGLAYPYDLPVYPVSSLATLAYEMKQYENTCGILAMIDARMNQVYWAHYNTSSLDSPEHVSHASDIKINTEKPLHLVGIDYQPYYQELPKTLQAKIIKQHELPLQASTMLGLVLSQKITPLTAAQALPSYVRNQVTQP